MALPTAENRILEAQDFALTLAAEYNLETYGLNRGNGSILLTIYADGPRFAGDARYDLIMYFDCRPEGVTLLKWTDSYVSFIVE